MASTTTPASTSTSGTRSAFFYGTLMAPSVLRRVTKHNAYPAHKDFHVRSALLANHRRHRVKAVDYPAIIPAEPDQNSTVIGTYVTGLTDADVWKLDIFEGDEYERVNVKVHILGERASSSSSSSVETRKSGDDSTAVSESEEVDAETYVWIASRDELEDEEWDFDEFVREKLARWAGIDSEEFAELDAAVREAQMNGTIQGGDPTRGRSFAGGEFERAVNGGGEGKGES